MSHHIKHQHSRNINNNTLFLKCQQFEQRDSSTTTITTTGGEQARLLAPSFHTEIKELQGKKSIHYLKTTNDTLSFLHTDNTDQSEIFVYNHDGDSSSLRLDHTRCLSIGLLAKKKRLLVLHASPNVLVFNDQTPQFEIQCLTIPNDFSLDSHVGKRLRISSDHTRRPSYVVSNDQRWLVSAQKCSPCQDENEDGDCEHCILSFFKLCTDSNIRELPETIELTIDYFTEARPSISCHYILNDSKLVLVTKSNIRNCFLFTICDLNPFKKICSVALECLDNHWFFCDDKLVLIHDDGQNVHIRSYRYCAAGGDIKAPFTLTQNFTCADVNIPVGKMECVLLRGKLLLFVAEKGKYIYVINPFRRQFLHTLATNNCMLETNTSSFFDSILVDFNGHEIFVYRSAWFQSEHVYKYYLDVFYVRERKHSLYSISEKKILQYFDDEQIQGLHLPSLLKKELLYSL